MALVSIITPSFNQAAFLEQTIQSVLLQDGIEIEYCVVDGASTDGSVEIIQRYSDKLAWWVSERDQGQAEAINKGFRRARGEIVAWLNSDDLYLPSAVQQAASALKANPSLGMVYGDAITIDTLGRPLNKLSFGEWQLSDLMAFRMICQPAVFMRRAVLEQAGYLDLEYHYMLDHHLWIRMARLAPIQHIPYVLAAARQHAGAKNVSQAAGFSLETQRTLEWMLGPAASALAGSGSTPLTPAPSPTALSSADELASILNKNRRNILSGAYRLQARYYLDGDQPAQSLKYYARAFWYNPSYALKHWHRMVYALISLAGAKKAADQILRPASARRKLKSVSWDWLDDSIQLSNTGRNQKKDWPGLNLG
jgi:glycosyltransferase involved in cell wall biosynthesis